MFRIAVPLSLVVVAALAGAQARTAVDVAKKTANTVNERNAAITSEQQAATQQAGGASGAAAGASQTTSQDSVARGATGSGAMSQRDPLTITREVYQYDGGGRRDPFLSLSRTGALRPHISELILVVAMVQTNGDRSVATIRDRTTNEHYLVKVGDSLGRYQVVRIEARAVTFAIQEFGFSRQERLVMGDTTTVRNQ
jgi:hypothetical protein